MNLSIQTVVSMPFAENSYILWLPGRTDAVVVDPGLEPQLIQDALDDRNLTVAAILNTHGHTDHIAGNGFFKNRFPGAPLAIGTLDAPMLTDPELNLSRSYGIDIVSPPADRLVREGEMLDYAGLTFAVLDLPGHSPGHVVFRLAEHNTLLGGDVLFRGGIGRTDFPGGDFRQLAEGIRGKLFPLPADTVVYPGHGPVTTIGHEKISNPFVGDGAERSW